MKAPTFKELMAPNKPGQQPSEAQKKFFVAAKTFENQLKELLGKEVNVHVVPEANPETGYMGLTAFWVVDGEEKSLRPGMQVFPECTPKQSTLAEMEAAYNEAVEKDWFVDRYDNPVARKIGIIVMNASSRIRYWADLKDLV